MSLKDTYIAIGFDKNGEAEFGITATIMSLSLDDMKRLREIIPTAIYIAESMWRTEQEKKYPGAQGNKKP